MMIPLEKKSVFILFKTWKKSQKNLFTLSFSQDERKRQTEGKKLSLFADGIDGKQARRTQTSGPLGELFDHGLDSWSTMFITTALYSVFGKARDIKWHPKDEGAKYKTEILHDVSNWNGRPSLLQIVFNFSLEECRLFDKFNLCGFT